MAIKAMEIEFGEQINPIRKLEKYKGVCIVNLAFRRQVSQAVGNFDVALNVGSTTRGAGNMEMFHRILAKGYSTFYDAIAFVWHLHRRRDKAFSRQLQDNGRSFGSYLLTCDRNRTVPRLEILHFACSRWLNRLLLRCLMLPGRLACKLVVRELLGSLQSPFAYREGYLQAQRLAAIFEVEPLVAAGGVR
ncbi:hypothetical protein NDI47_17980 [Microcoleus vaginatus GB1-A2]|uniref:hypothetical protein n=1 Tax=Microcoleus vaginatus TaxID=119532 RepID=UPI0032AA59CC